jgi:hypothetical protein
MEIFRPCNPKHNQDGENCEIKDEMPTEAEIPADMSKTTAADIDAARLRDNTGEDENRDQRG